MITRTVGAQTIRHVPADFPTIQAAIVASVNGDTVLVSPGTYVENVDFLGKAIVVRSEAGPDATTIDGGGLAIYVVRFVSGEPSAAVLSGFTVRNSISGGVLVNFGASPTIVGNVIGDNTGCLNGVGILMGGSSSLVSGNVITQNIQVGCSGGEGGAIYMSGDCSGARILDNVISNNHHSSGGGLALAGAGSPLIQGNVISGNTASLFSGGIGWNASTPRLIQNLIVGNLANNGGGGIALSGVPSSPQTIVANNTVVGNICPIGSAFYAQNGIPTPLLVRNNILRGVAGQTTVFAPTAVGSSFGNNDVYSPGGSLYGGGMPNLNGLNGNFSADPLFVNASQGDYHLQPTSPCIDAGNAPFPSVPATDPDGDARVYDGNGDGPAVIDVGFDERTPAVRFGSACPGTFGLAPRIGVLGPPPALGNASFALTVTNLPGGTTAVLVIGLTRAIPPIDLTSLGLPSCSLDVAPAICLVTTSSGSGLTGGSTLTALAIPNDPALQGFHLYFQGYAADFPGPLVPGGLSLALDVGVP